MALATDLALALDPVLLAIRAGMTPDSWQASLLRSTDRQIILNCSRQAGKSTVSSLLALRTRVAALLAALLGASVLVSRPGPVPALVVLAGSVALLAAVLVALVLKRGVAVVVPLWGIAMLAFVGWTEIRAGAGPTTTTMGQVRSVNVFQTPQSTSRRTLITLQAFDRVHVSYAPAGSTSPRRPAVRC